MKKQNILLIVLDSVQAAYLSCYGYKWLTTPFLDKLASVGIRYENAISPATWSVPCHASLFTGLYLSEHRLNAAERRLSREISTLAEILSQVGYRTAMFSNNPHVGTKTGLDRGFETVFSPERLAPTYAPLLRHRATNLIVRKTALRDYVEPQGWIGSEQRTATELTRWLKASRPGADPYFAFVNFWTVHPPRTPPHRFVRHYLKAWQLARLVRIFGNPISEHYNAGVQKPTDEDVQYIRNIYAASLRFLDSILQHLFDQLANERLLDNTVIIISADHGEALGEHGLWSHQLSVYDSLIRVPLILIAPQLFPEGIVYDEPVQLCDIFPTVLAIAGESGHSLPLQMRRSDLLARIRNPLAELHYQYAFSESYDDGGGLTRRLLALNPKFDTSALAGLYSVRTKRFKYIEGPRTRATLFDCVADPLEQHDLLDSQPSLVAELRSALGDWRASLHDFGISYPNSEG